MIDQPLCEETISDCNWLLASHLGTITDVVNYNSGAETTSIVNSLEYNSFGEITSDSDSTKTPHYAFTGREWDADADLYYYRARWYDPTAGRFVSEDPIGFRGGFNLNSYVNNMPTLASDPSGKIIVITIAVLGGMTLLEQLALAAVLGLTLAALWELVKSTPISIPLRLPEPECNKDACLDDLADCIANPWQPDWNKGKFGKRKDCGACYGSCKLNGGVWPKYQCP